MVDTRDPWKPAKMVGWYDPTQLFRTAIQVVKSSLFAENADGRLIQPLFDPSPGIYDERYAPGKSEVSGAPRSAITVDYIADTGDGFDSTYAVAYFATAAELEPDDPDKLVPESARGMLRQPGSVLLLGGDEVYPTASGEEYERRFVHPFRMASSEFGAHDPAIYSIPGNHDWYDNLVAFTRLFIREHKIGGFRSRQRRSYFVLELPHQVFVLAPDVQLGSDIDQTQYEYFESVAKQLPDDARVLMCTAEPHWVTDNESLRDGTKVKTRSSRLVELERLIDGDGERGRIRALLAGDLHHYRRHVGRVGVGRSETQLITAGGGGAFLHPTHGWRDGSDPRRTRRDARLPPGLPGYEFKRAFPDPETSRGLTKRVLLFPCYNASFLKASAAVYGAAALQVILGARLLCLHDPGMCVDLDWNLLGLPSVVLLASLIIGAFVSFTDTSSKAYRYGAGLIHGTLHAAAAVAIPVLAVGVGGAIALGLEQDDAALSPALAWILEWVPWAPVVLMILVTTAIGAVFGGVLMGIYLYVSLNWFSRHRNEAFSALREDGWKNFLRIRVDEAGKIHVFALGIERPPTDWEPKPGTDRWIPKGRHTNPVVVDYVAID